MLRLRYANSGPEAKPGGAGSLLGDFAVHARYAIPDQNYDAPSSSTGDMFTLPVQTNPVVPQPFQAQATIPLPSSEAPPGYVWAMLVQFTGAVTIIVAAEEGVALAMRLEYSSEEDGFVPIAYGGSGTYLGGFAASPDAQAPIALSALRNLDDFEIAEDATSIVIRCGWGKGPDASTSTVRIATQIGENLENPLGGWDMQAQWVLRPAQDP